MTIDLTTSELNKLDEIDKKYDKLVKEYTEKVKALRDVDPFSPNEEEYEAIQAKRIPEPTPPKPIRERDGIPVYSKKEYEAYKNTPEYKHFKEINDKVNKEVNEQWDNWYNAGSKEWREAWEELSNLDFIRAEEATAVFKAAEDRYMKELGTDPADVLADAKRWTDRIISDCYSFYDKKRNNGSFSAKEVRSLDDGNFRLDAGKMKADILDRLYKHIRILGDTTQLEKYIDMALATSPFVDHEQAGILGGMVQMREKPDLNKKGLSARRPREYKRSNTKVSGSLFKNQLTTTEPNFFVPVGLNEQKDVKVFANFIPPINANFKGVDAYIERVYSGAWSCKLAGNQFIPLSMLYSRGILGLPPEEKTREPSERAIKDMLEALECLNGTTTITDDPYNEHLKDPKKDYFLKREALLFYQYDEERVHGKLTRGIVIPNGYVPIMYRYAEENKNEIQTDPIENIYIEGQVYSRDNIVIDSTLYREIKTKQYWNTQKRYSKEMPENKRTITYEYVYNQLALSHEIRDMKPQKKYSDLSPTERNRLRKHIDLCMKSYQKRGLFHGYEHKKDNSKSFYAVVLYFNEPKKISG